MSWLHQLTGFQLWVIAAFYGIALNHAGEQLRRSKKTSDVPVLLYALAAGLFFEVYWFVVAAWPAIT